MSGTLVDTNGQTWLSASYRIELIPAFGNPNAPLNQGTPVTGPFTGFTNGSGAFTATLDDNTIVTPSGSTWKFTICPNASVNNCSTSIQVVHGASMNLGASISADLQPIQVSSSPTIARAYQDSEVNGGQGALYWRTLDNTLRGCSGVCNGTNWVSIGSGGGSSVWGAITGLLSNQIDLQTALNAKMSLTPTGDQTITGGFNFILGPNGSNSGVLQALFTTHTLSYFIATDGTGEITYNDSATGNASTIALNPSGNIALVPKVGTSVSISQGDLIFGITNTQDIGSTSNRIKTGWFGTSIVAPVYQTTLSTPSSSSATCIAGQVWADTGFVYTCTATNTIKRATLNTF